MFVCICHALSDRDIEEARQTGVADDQKLFEHFGVEVNCGRCVTTISELLCCSENEAGGAMHACPGCKRNDTSEDVA